jgi:hypothetical protein
MEDEMKLNIKEAVSYSKVSRATLYRLMDESKELASYYIGSRRFIESEDIDKLYKKICSNDEILNSLA